MSKRFSNLCGKGTVQSSSFEKQYNFVTFDQELKRFGLEIFRHFELNQVLNCFKFLIYKFLIYIMGKNVSKNQKRKTIASVKTFQYSQTVFIKGIAQ